jgi:hypothetical protein
MDAVTLTVVIHGIGMFSLICGGIAAMYFGYRIFGKASKQQAAASVKFSGFHATAKGTGAVIMMTASLWGYCGVKIAPNLTTDINGSKVYSFEVGHQRVTAPALATALSNNQAMQLLPMNASEITSLFDKSLSAQQAIYGDKLAKIQGRWAVIDPAQTSVVTQKDGMLLLSATLKAGDKFANVMFVPKRVGSAVVFTPSAADSSTVVPKEPNQ